MSNQPGRDPAQPRREVLDGLLADLSVWDVLYIRQKFRDGQIPVTGLATLVDLPPEIISQIGWYLPLDTILDCRLVCRGWRKAWTHGAVVTSLCQHFFPGLLEVHRAQLSAQETLFRSEARRHLRRRLEDHEETFIPWNAQGTTETFRGNFGSSTPASKDADRLRLDSSHQVLYCNGKVAWQPESSCVLIDDLRVRKRARCAFVHETVLGHHLVLRALSQSLVVLLQIEQEQREQYGRVVHVWHIERREWKKLVLPAAAGKVFADHETVVLGLRRHGGEILTWSWAGKAALLNDTHQDWNAPPAGCRRSSPYGGMGVLFHPFEEDVFYVILLYKHFETVGYTTAIVKYKGTEPVRRFETEIPLLVQSHLLLYHSNVRVECRCQRVNNEGLWAVTTAFVRPPALAAKYWSSVCFNVLTESFYRHEYELLEGVSFADSPHTTEWNRNGDPNMTICWDNELLVLGSDQSSHDSVKDVCRMQPVFQHFRVLRMNGKPAEARCSVERWAYRHMQSQGRAKFTGIFADDDFVVAVSDKGLRVWTMSAEMEAPGIPCTSNRYETLENWRLT